MRALQARKQRILALIVGCAISVLLLHSLLFEVAMKCNPGDVPTQGKRMLSGGRKFQDYLLIEHNVVNAAALGNKDFAKRPPVESLKINATAKIEDVMTNVSFSDLLHVIEIDSLDERSFSNWTQTYLQTSHRNSFRMPPFTEQGVRVCDNNTEMIIIMPANPYQGFTRELIRQTWASSLYGVDIPQMRTNPLRTKLAFIFGTSRLPEPVKEVLQRESSRYKDVVSADFVDSYRNLSLKMMVGLKWVSEHCSSAKYVVKSDLDTFVNLPLLSRFLLEISVKIPRFILGHRHTWPKHPVSRSGRWKVEKEDYPFESFPPYLLGHSYVITGELAPLLVYASEHLPLIPTEDSFITGVLARVIRAPRLHHEGFASVFKRVFSCKIVHNYEMSVTRMTESRLILLWRDQLNNVCSDTELPERLDLSQSERNALRKGDSINKQKRVDKDQAMEGDSIQKDGQVKGNESIDENKIKLEKWKFF